jgi:2-oxo-4-hydroxy-4-carboxy-5-ureidoimidazoline decarboxylase
VRIEEFNAMDAAAAAELVRPCAAIDSFVEGLVAGRPYADVPALLDGARVLAETWTDAEVDAALRDHPRIGERPAEGSAGAAMSRSEQAGVDPADADLQRRLAEGNRRYEERFGRIYLVRAKGRSAEELLGILEQRLDNDDAAEADVVRAQLGEIAVLRLAGLFDDAPPQHAAGRPA